MTRITEAELAAALKRLRYPPIMPVGAKPGQGGSAHFERDNDRFAAQIVEQVLAVRKTHVLPTHVVASRAPSAAAKRVARPHLPRA